MAFIQLHGMLCFTRGAGSGMRKCDAGSLKVPAQSMCQQTPPQRPQHLPASKPAPAQEWGKGDDGDVQLATTTRRDLLVVAAAAVAGWSLVIPMEAVQARPEGVNKPELLPQGEFKKVIDLENYLTSGEEVFLVKELDRIEAKKGVKIRVLTQKYPKTPGAAIKDYWKVDDDTVVLVCDYFGGNGNLLKFNVGENVYRVLPPRFWSLLASQYGNKFYIQKNGEDLAIINSLQRVTECLLSGGCMTP